MDSTRTKWEGRWDQLKGKAQQAWGDLTDDDLDVAEGNYDEFVGRIKERTGETVEAIEDRLSKDDMDHRNTDGNGGQRNTDGNMGQVGTDGNGGQRNTDGNIGQRTDGTMGQGNTDGNAGNKDGKHEDDDLAI